MHDAPGYKEILHLNEEEGTAWILKWNNSPYRDMFLDQMVEHEEQTHSFAKSMQTFHPDQLTDSITKIYSLFVREDTMNTRKVFLKIWETTGTDMITHAIFAKSSEDRFGPVKELALGEY